MGTNRRQYQREYMRTYRRRQRVKADSERESARLRALAALPLVDLEAPAGDVLRRWSRENLVVPSGHPRSGEALELPGWAGDFISAASRVPESLLCMARKNAKSAVCAVWGLGCLVGPLRSEGWRGAVASLTVAKARELTLQCQSIAEASALKGLTFRKSPSPMIESDSGCLEVLACDRSAGHASSFDLVLVDELGLLAERHRELLNGLRSSTSSKSGRVVSLSVVGDAPFTQELISRRGSSDVHVTLFSAPADCKLDDETAWSAANPGLGSIKSRAYMEQASRRAISIPADAAAFRSLDLNLRQHPSRQLIVSVEDWKAIETTDLPPMIVPGCDGPCVVGLDMGGARAMSCAVAIWPKTGRLKAWAAFGSEPSLKVRGEADQVGGLYERMAERGELKTYPGRVTPVPAFLADLSVQLAGERVIAVGADRFLSGDLSAALSEAGCRHWPNVTWRGTGASATADGSADVRAFQRLVIGRKLKAKPSLLMASAIAESSLRYDSGGNAALDKARHHSRIDALQAAVIAAGLAEQATCRSEGRGWNYKGFS